MRCAAPGCVDALCTATVAPPRARRALYCIAVVPRAPQVTDMRRIVPRQYGTNLYKYQHIYLPFLYGFLGCAAQLLPLMQ